MPTQQEYNLSKQRARVINIKINLLNSKFEVVGNLNGQLVTEPSFSINADSDIRRTCNLTITPTDSSFDIQYGNKIWLDKYVQIFVGQQDVITKEYEYTNMGIYMVNNPQRLYSVTDNTLTIQGIDLMAKLTGLRNGNLEGMTHVIPKDSNVRNAIISTLELAGFTKYEIEECSINVPNDINISVGGTVYNILSALRDILPNYQMYFDVDGVFHYNMIPSGDNEPIFADDDLWEVNLLSYEKNTDFTTLKNSIEVYGKTHDVKYYVTEEYYDDNFKITLNDVDKLLNGDKIGVLVYRRIYDYPYGDLGVNCVFKYKKVNEDGSIEEITKNRFYRIFNEYERTPYFPQYTSVIDEKGSVYYVFQYVENENGLDYFSFLGLSTPYAEIKETNEESPFCVYNENIGEIREVLSGGEYDNIYTDSLAYERAKWELYKKCRLKDSVTLTCIPIYWLDVNKIINITLPNKYGELEKEKYVIKSIGTSTAINGTQSITLAKYYPYYSSFTKDVVDLNTMMVYPDSNSGFRTEEKNSSYTANTGAYSYNEFDDLSETKNYIWSTYYQGFMNKCNEYKYIVYEWKINKQNTDLANSIFTLNTGGGNVYSYPYGFYGYENGYIRIYDKNKNYININGSEDYPVGEMYNYFCFKYQNTLYIASLYEDFTYYIHYFDKEDNFIRTEEVKGFVSIDLNEYNIENLYKRDYDSRYNGIKAQYAELESPFTSEDLSKVRRLFNSHIPGNILRIDRMGKPNIEKSLSGRTSLSISDYFYDFSRYGNSNYSDIYYYLVGDGRIYPYVDYELSVYLSKEKPEDYVREIED